MPIPIHFKSDRRLLLTVALAAACLACAGNGVPARSVGSVEGQGVPELPPERVSAAFMDSVFAPSNLLSDGRGPSSVPKNLLVVAFRPGSSVAAKSAAVQAVQGVVVGGYRLSADRYYYVRVPATGDSRSLGEFLDRMNAQPAVRSATPLGLAGVEVGSPADGAPDTTRPVLPDGFAWPQGAEVRTVQAPGDSMTPFMDDLVLVEFTATANGKAIRELISGLHGSIVGGFPRASYYVIRIPPVEDYAALLKIVRALRASPIVAGAMAQPNGEAGDIPP